MFADPTFDSIPAFFLAILPEMSEYLQVSETAEIASSPRAGKKPYDPVNLPKESANETLPSVFRGKEPPYFHCCKLYFGSFFPYVSFLTCFLFGSFLRVGPFFQSFASNGCRNHPCPEERQLTATTCHRQRCVIVDHFSSSRWKRAKQKKRVW